MGSQKRCLWAPRQIKGLDIFFENTACFLSQRRCPQPRKFSEKLSFGMSRLCLDASAGSLPAGEHHNPHRQFRYESWQTTGLPCSSSDAVIARLKMSYVSRESPQMSSSRPSAKRFGLGEAALPYSGKLGGVLTFGLEAPEPGRTRNRGSAAPCLVPVGQCKASAHVEVRQLMPGSSYSTCISR